MNSIFKIANLGKLKYVISLVDFDYPRTFVCKKVDSDSLELYLFDELNHGDDFVEWICTQISFDDLDRLSRGLITLESCFYGPRNSTKPGYIVTSNKDKEFAVASCSENISIYIPNNNTYIEPLVDDNHGSGLLSLVYESPFFSVIIKPEKYADPMIDTTRITNGSTDFKAMANAWPFGIETKNSRMCLSHTHSLVMYFEISDKKCLNSSQGTLNEEFSENAETHDAFEAINTILRKESTSEQIINAFKGDSKSIEKTNKFISEVKKNNKNNKVIIEAVDYSSGEEKKISIIHEEINDDTIINMTKRKEEVFKIIDDKNNHNITNFMAIGQFLMLDTTGRKKFKFQSIEPDGSKTIISGFSEISIDGLSVSDDGTKKYEVRIQSDVLKGEFGVSKPTYKLLEIVSIIDNPEQLHLFK